MRLASFAENMLFVKEQVRVTKKENRLEMLSNLKTASSC
jgi:hypothetical protein